MQCMSTIGLRWHGVRGIQEHIARRQYSTQLSKPTHGAAELLTDSITSCSRAIDAVRRLALKHDEQVSRSRNRRAELHSELERSFPQLRAMRTIGVELRQFNGQVINIGTALSSTVSDLKSEIAKFHRIPSISQTLVWGTSRLEDDVPLASLRHADGSVLVLTLVVSMAEALQKSVFSCRNARREIAEAFAELAPQDDDSVASVCALAADGAWEVRRAAMHALGCISIKGNQSALNAVRDGLEDARVEVRLAALEAVMTFTDHKPSGQAPCNDRRITACIFGCFLDTQTDVRQAALKALFRVVPKGDEHAISLVRRLTLNSRPEVKTIALQALALVAQDGGDQAVSTAISCMSDRSMEVRREAFVALSKLASPGDVRSIKAATAQLGSESVDMSLLALKTLARIACECTDSLACVLGQALEHEDGEVRLAATKVFSKFAQNRDELGIAAICALFQGTNPIVRMAALEALRPAAVVGHGRALDALLPLQMDLDPMVRTKAQGMRKEITTAVSEPVIQITFTGRGSHDVHGTDHAVSDIDEWSVEDDSSDEDDLVFGQQT